MHYQFVYIKIINIRCVPWSQLTPVHPGWQAHVYLLISSIHRPLFWHGLDAHSLISGVSTKKKCVSEIALLHTDIAWSHRIYGISIIDDLNGSVVGTFTKCLNLCKCSSQIMVCRRLKPFDYFKNSFPNTTLNWPTASAVDLLHNCTKYICISWNKHWYVIPYLLTYEYNLKFIHYFTYFVHNWPQSILVDRCTCNYLRRQCIVLH